ncbi:MAG: NAD(P)/FAD-dependent oxidoreductase [Coriobacteriia bacterium]|nr:NAD(P)/FAD-dependent oxidoreductase [Coriobacteriia bacterium]
MRASGITVINGRARLSSRSSVQVSGVEYRFEDLAVAAGATPVELGIPGSDRMTTSEQFLDIDELPDSVIFIGGGYVSFELAWLARRAGSEVTIVHRSTDVLRAFDPDLTSALLAHYESQGIRIVTDAPAIEIRENRDLLEVVTPGAVFEAKMVVHGAGRAAAVSKLELERADVAYGPQGIKVSRQLRSITNPKVWAAGDVADLGEPLTPVASHQGSIVADNILGADRDFDPPPVPTVVFSDPPLASVGVTVREARSNASHSVVESDMGSWFTQARIGNSIALARVIEDRESGAILGAHLLGIGADEFINLFALAIGTGATVQQVEAILWAYPTVASDIKYIV